MVMIRGVLCRYIIKAAPEMVMAREGGLDGKLPAHVAAEEGNCEILDLLMEGSSMQALSAQDNHRQTLVHYAAKSGKLNVIQYVVEHGGSSLLIAASSSSGMTPAMMAASGRSPTGANSVMVLDYLVEEMGPMVLLSQNHKGETPLHVAILNNRRGSINAILKRVMEGDETLKEMLNMQDKAGNTPLHLLLKKRAADKEIMEVSITMKTLRYASYRINDAFIHDSVTDAPCCRR